MRDLRFDLCKVTIEGGEVRTFRDATVSVRPGGCCSVSSEYGASSFVFGRAVLDAMGVNGLLVSGLAAIDQDLVPCFLTATYRLDPHRSDS